MPYIGNPPANRFVTPPEVQRFNGDNSTTEFTLANTIGADQDILVSVDGVIQDTTSYSVNDKTLTFTTAPSSGTNNIFVFTISPLVASINHPATSPLNATSGTFTSDLTVDTNTLYVDSSNNRIGVNTLSPSVGLHVEESTTGDAVKIAKGGNYILIGGSGSGTQYIKGYEGTVAFGNEFGGNTTFLTGDTERMRIDSSGNVAIGSNDPQGFQLQVNTGVAGNIARFTDGVNANTVIKTSGSVTTFGPDTTNSLAFQSNSSEKMRIDTNGYALFGTTALPSSSVVGFSISPSIVSTNPHFSSCGAATGSVTHFNFINGNGTVGNITTNAGATAFNTSSDYRLKENVTEDWDATTRLKQLNPVRFNFIADADTTVDGFLAHEVQSVVPEAITGTHNQVEVWKDDEELPDGVSVGDNKLDEDGNTIPIYQSIDQSKLVPLLVKTIQELEARITALENA